MGLGIPSVVCPLSEWLDSVPVEGCLRGATVTVQTDDAAATVVASGTSGGGSDLVPVVFSGALKIGQRLVAKQTLGSEVSASTPSKLAVSVGASPASHAQLPPLSFRSRLYACGTALWLRGAAPGAQVTVSFGAVVLGTGRAGASGDARLLLSTHLPSAGNTVSAIQGAPPAFPALAGTPQVAEGRTIAPPLGRLPRPDVEAPKPMGCDSSVRIDSVIDGATVTVTRASDGSKDTAAFDLDRLWFRLSAPFPAGGDQIAVTQALAPACEIQPSDPVIADVRPAEAPDSIEVVPPCAGSNYVRVGKLRPGATLVMAVGGQEPLRYIVPDGRTTWDVPVEALPAGKSVTMTLSVCGFSVSSTVPIVDDLPPPRPEVIKPLYACGRAVSVQTRASSYVELWADFGPGAVQISARARAGTGLVTLDVFPSLSVPESVWARQLSCGGDWLESDHRPVAPHPRLDPLELSEPVEGQGAVVPLNVVSGAHVTVWASSRTHSGKMQIGERNVTRADPAVRLARRLTTDDVVWAVQEMCGWEPQEEPHYTVLPGTMTFLLPAPMEQLSGESLDGKVIVHSAELACRFVDGFWILFADIENTETDYDCQLVFGVSLGLPSPLSFGETLDADFAAANMGLPEGLYIFGYPSRWTPKKTGTFAQLQNLAFWKEVLNASADWKMLVAWRNYAAPPEKPEWVKGEHAPPDPFHIFPEFPPDDD